MTPLRLRLLAARKKYSRCAHLLELQIKASGLTPLLSERVIGCGVAVDWVRRAAEMDDLAFIGNQLNESEHKPSFVELLRFNFSWFGLNAIFSRPRLLSLVGAPSSQSELDAFLVLFNKTVLPNAQAQLTELHGYLQKSTSPRMPGLARGTAVTTLTAIQAKYLDHAASKGTTAKQIALAASSGNIASLGLPTLLYAFRNWSVHGAALDGSFGTRPGFVRYVEILQEVLAEVHCSTADEIETAI